MMFEVELSTQSASIALRSRLVYGDQIEGVQFHSLIEHPDNRGSFTEFFKDRWNCCIDPVQWSVVRSEAHVFRGCHFHKRHDEFFSLLGGECLVGLKDIRPGSPTKGVSSLYRLYDSDPVALSFPRGLVHGWYFFEKSTHVQAVSECYDDYGIDDNLGCRWDDPDLDLPWGVEKVILSKRAASFPSLKKLMADSGFAI